jgi:hypothetical protein
MASRRGVHATRIASRQQAGAAGDTHRKQAAAGRGGRRHASQAGSGAGRQQGRRASNQAVAGSCEQGQTRHAECGRPCRIPLPLPPSPPPEPQTCRTRRRAPGVSRARARAVASLHCCPPAEGRGAAGRGRRVGGWGARWGGGAAWGLRTERHSRWSDGSARSKPVKAARQYGARFRCLSPLDVKPHGRVGLFKVCISCFLHRHLARRSAAL